MSRQWAEQGVNNLEPAELGLRSALLNDGRTLLEKLVQSAADSFSQAQSQKGEKCHADRPRTVDTIFGSIEIKRDYFYSPKDHQGRCPLDQALGLIDDSSPGLVRLVSRAAAREGFEAASGDLKELARTHFPLAILILDFYHMMEYLHELSQLLYGKDTPWAGRMKAQWKEQMQKDEVQVVIGQSGAKARCGRASEDEKWPRSGPEVAQTHFDHENFGADFEPESHACRSVIIGDC